MGPVFEPVAYAHDSPTTGGLGRLGGPGWSAFAKVVQSYRHWSRWPLLPAESREALFTLGRGRWRQEVDLYLSDLGDRLPAGLRLPVVHGVVDLQDERLLLVLEDVDVDDSPWNAEHFARAARLLGRLHVRMTEAAILPGDELRPSELLHTIATSRLGPVALPPLAADATWRHPLLNAERHLRDDLAELARRVPRLLDVVTALPQLQSHGDATPHNLLVPRDESDVFVVIDWAMASLAAVGDDLGQLLIGLAHDDLLQAEALSDLHELLTRSYVRGLAEEGYHVDEELVRLGMDAGLAVRSAFTALPLERLGEPITDELAERFRQRLALTRYLVDVGLAATTQRHADVA
jgi:hypothetical protein